MEYDFSIEETLVIEIRFGAWTENKEMIGLFLQCSE